jgi:RecA/RadA recombinase
MKRTRRTSKKSSCTADIAAILRENAVKEFGENTVVDPETFRDSVYGIPLTGNLPLQYVLGVDVIALGRWISIVGKFGSLKTTLAWYIARRFMETGGFTVFLDAELKSSPDQVLAILQDDNMYDSQVFNTRIKTLDMMLNMLVYWAKEYDNLIPNKDLPICLLVDSIASVTSDKAIKSMKKEGSADKGFGAAQRAASLAENLRAFVPEYLGDNPMLLLTINHLKEKIEEKSKTSFGPPATTSPGGDHKDFMASYIIETWKGQTKRAKTSDPTIDLWITTKKSGLGFTGNKIMVKLFTYHDENNRQVSTFDWDRSLVDLLLGDTLSVEGVKDVVHITGTGNSLGCRELGLSKVSKTELGAAIHGNPEMVAGLQRLMRIKNKRVFDGSAAS